MGAQRSPRSNRRGSLARPEGLLWGQRALSSSCLAAGRLACAYCTWDSCKVLDFSVETSCELLLRGFQLNKASTGASRGGKRHDFGQKCTPSLHSFQILPVGRLFQLLKPAKGSPNFEKCLGGLF